MFGELENPENGGHSLVIENVTFDTRHLVQERPDPNGNKAQAIGGAIEFGIVVNVDQWSISTVAAFNERLHELRLGNGNGVKRVCGWRVDGGPGIATLDSTSIHLVIRLRFVRVNEAEQLGIDTNRQ